MTSEWTEWHSKYGEGQPLEARLRLVQAHLRSELDRRPAGPIRILSLCSGDGRDVIGAARGHPRANDVTGYLVDLDPTLVSEARRKLATERLHGLEVIEGDAGACATFTAAVPADIVLTCGIYGNISDEDIQRTIARLPSLCAPRALNVWTRGRFAPDLTPTIRAWYQQSGFDSVGFDPIPDTTMSVGAERLIGVPSRFDSSARLFRFLPAGERPSDKSR